MTPALVNQAVSGLGGLDILAKNAGRQQSHDSILDITTEQFDWTLRTSPYAVVLDYEGRDSAHAARFGDHQQKFGERVRSVCQTARLRDDKGDHRKFHQRQPNR
jgi:NAD(P)-dependent dehydrogenase (short-subunit alcohol dehydrogenase family)